MIVATFNVENLFERPKAMNEATWSKGQPALDAAGELNSLFNKPVYSPADKRRMVTLLKKFGLLETWARNPYLELRKVRGRLTQGNQVVANGRDDWVGWVELKKERIDDDAILNTARVIAAVNPDILVLIEVENRPSVQRFHDKVLRSLVKEPYPYNMIIDGNDERGIDVGLLSRYPIQRMRSHISDRVNNTTRPTFSRDCPEYYVELPSGRELLILPNHFTSKGSDRTGKRRKVQAAAVRDIYQPLSKRFPYAIVAGDLNDHPGSAALSPLLEQTQLVDAMSTEHYTGAYPGTYRGASAQEKIDYLLLSPSLQRRVSAVDVFRKGYYAPSKWESFDTIDAKNKDRMQASDHHCLWAALDV